MLHFIFTIISRIVVHRQIDRVALLLSAIAFYIVVLALTFACLAFLSVGVGHLLATTIAPHFAYLIVAACYGVALIIVIIKRKKIFVKPIARYITALLKNMHF